MFPITLNRSLYCLLLLLVFMRPDPVLAEAEFDAAIFQESIRQSMGNSVLGYAVVVADRNGIIAKVSDGYARAPGDGNLRMKTFAPANIGSATKLMTGVALLDMLEQHMVTSLSVTSQLNTPMVFYTPDRWRTVYAVDHPELRRITLRHLLSHQSGLAAEPGSGGSHGTKIGRALSQGATASAIGNGRQQYNNNNFTILGYVIASIAYPNEIDRFERENEHAGLADYNRRAAEFYLSRYERYIRERFLPKTLVQISPTCRPGADIPNGRFAKEYSSRTDPSGSFTDAGYCRSQGSWFFSAQELVQFARSLELSSRYVSSATRNLMFNDRAGSRTSALNQALAYNRAIVPGNFGTSIGLNWLAGHGGRTGNGHNAIVMRLPFERVGAGIVTSNEVNPTTLSNRLVSAYYDATRDWDEYNTDRPGSDIGNFNLSRPDPTLCRIACDNNAACEAWTYVKPGRQGPKARCWLKSAAPAPRSNSCCASGVKGASYDIDRPGSDIVNRALQRSDPALCRKLCGQESRCRAWTFVKPGVQGSAPRCYLKHSVPAVRHSSCCVSGRRP